MSAGGTTTSARLRGKILEWHAAKGCGFADDGRRRVFIHIREFAERHTTPRVGDQLTYSLGTDKQGRPCAKEILQINDGGRLRPVDLVILALLLATPGAALARLAPREAAFGAVAWIIVASVLSYALYAWDKHRARAGAWRISERTLHFWEILGGWPGAYLAQRRLRHKAAKPAYLVVFWLIVAAHNYAALDWQLDWRLTRTAADTARSWLETPASSNGNSPGPRSRVY